MQGSAGGKAWSALAFVRNQTRGTVLCARAQVARTIRDRSRGLLGRQNLSADEGILFEAGLLPLMWMHTLFMRFPIDIIFLGRRDVVIGIEPALKPWRCSAVVLGACKALELSQGAASRTGTQVGDSISIIYL
jgi:uncharacterized membrane protein (UPF0127 family)